MRFSQRTIRRSLHLLKVNAPLFLKRAVLELRAQYTKIPDRPVVRLVKGLQFEFNVQEDSYTKQMYLGLYESGVRYCMEQFLKKGDIFIDAGASIGYLTVCGAALVGTEGQVHSFEPVPCYFERLKKVATMNPEYRIIPNQCALGEEEGEVKMYLANSHIVNNTILPNLIKKESIGSTVVVPIRRLDSYIKEQALGSVRLIKIDTEGFEFSVLKGLEQFFLERPQQLPVIVCEICNPALGMLGYTVGDIFQYMEKFSYLSYDIFNPNKRLSREDVEREHTIDIVFRPYEKDRLD